MEQLTYELKLSQNDLGVLKRLFYEINGYEVLIRSFTVADAELTLEDEKWRELVDTRSRLWQMKEEIISRLCAQEDKPFSGAYKLDLNAGVLQWG